MKKIECIVDKGIRKVEITPSEFSRMSGISRQLLWKHKEDPRLNWRALQARKIVKVMKRLGVQMEMEDLLTRSINA